MMTDSTGTDAEHLQLSNAIDSFLTGYFSTHQRASKTIAAYTIDLQQLEKFVGPNVSLPSFNSTSIELWAAHLKAKHYSPSSIRRKLVAVRVFVSYWMRKGELKDSPFWRVKVSLGRTEMLPRSLSESEMFSLLACAREDAKQVQRLTKPAKTSCSSSAFRASRNSALVEIMFATGIRVGEVASLKITDINLEDQVLNIRGKGGKPRLAYIVDHLAISCLGQYLDLRLSIETTSEYLFLNHAGDRISTQGIASALSNLTARARLTRHITPHMLRHTVATLLLRNGVDIKVVQEFLGHSSIATTQRYTHVSKEHLIKVLRMHHPSFDVTSFGQQILSSLQ